MISALEDLAYREEDLTYTLAGGKVQQAILIEIIYKNGVTKEFWCKDFEIDSGIYRWNAISAVQKPLYLNADDVSSVWVKDITIITKNDYRFPNVLIGYKEFFEGE